MNSKSFSQKTKNFTQILYQKEYSKQTIKKYERDILKFYTFLLTHTYTHITKNELIEYKNELLKKYKPASVNSFLIPLNQFFRYYKKPHLNVKTVRIQRTSSVDNVFTKSEYKILLKHALKQKKIRLYLIMRTLACTGIRVGELSFITVEILKTGRTAVANKGKIREILLPHSLCKDLIYYCKKLNIQSGIIFKSKTTPLLIDKTWIWREMKKTAVLSGIEPQKVHAHSFRHFFAKTFLAKYNDIVDLADILGHSSIETTRIYTRTSQNEKQSRINKLGL